MRKSYFTPIVSGVFMEKLVVVCSALLLLAAGVLPMEIETEITDVTVYPNLARIVRMGTVALEPGENELEISRLPATLVNESVHMRVQPANLELSNIQVEEFFLAKPGEQRVLQLENQLDELAVEDREHENQIKILQSKEKLLLSIQAETSHRASETVYSGPADVSNWDKALVFTGDRLEEIYASILSHEIERKELAAMKQVLEKQLSELSGQRARVEKWVTCIVFADRAVEVEMTLSYLIRNVSWIPLYELRTLSADKQVDILYSAEVEQKTGEDWNDVNLTLSTATPHRGARMPEMSPWDIGLLDLRSEARGVLKMEGAPAPLATAAEEPEEDYTIVSGAIAETKGVSTSFRIRKKSDILTGEDPCKVTILRKTFAAELSHAAVPKLQESAFLTGTTINDTSFPLLGGQAQVYVDGDFVGNTVLENIAPGESFDLSLGIDEGIRVKHELVQKIKHPAGILGKNARTDYVFKITVENYKSDAVVCKIIDQVPRSQHALLAVRDVELIPEPGEWNRETGQLTWLLALEPAQTREISISFVVSYPGGTQPFGLF
jgi:uncharacterized protein (TIGR02231 family)